MRKIDIYRRIRERREFLKMSQEELAQKLGYKSRSTIAKIESGENDIPQSKIIAFAEALNVEPGYLMGWENNQKPEPSISQLEKDLSSDEKSIILRYRILSEEARARISDQIDFELFRQNQNSQKGEKNLG